ncbi:hypothetical protein H072_6371 [Dactylellina haptotyla CBS 200.50]|uniref:Uncharacterized protein n=1 Tax=Dactylellina haptotyla (strain CBS 200.50) TaxID=1284197 RepID=S8BKP4_DACHA|nr:hypothetical protein H072_6371 [Dactylellina haptotyla CBS 200.50]
MKFFVTITAVMSFASLALAAPQNKAAGCMTTYKVTTTLSPTAIEYKKVKNDPEDLDCKGCKLTVATITVTQDGYKPGMKPVATITMDEKNIGGPICLMGVMRPW